MIGKRIKELRILKHISQSELSRALNMKQSTIANYEKDTRSPNLETLIALASYFDVTLDDLVGNDLTGTDIVGLSDKFLDYLLVDDIDKAKSIALRLLNQTDLKTVYFKLFRYALTKLGWLWEVGEITISQEHETSYEIAKMIGQLEGKSSLQNDKSIIGMVAPGEKHTFGLQMLMSLLKEDGFKTKYIGEAVPKDDLTSYIKEGSYDYLILSITNELWLDRLMDRISGLDKIKICIVGSGAKKLELTGIDTFATYEACLEALNG
ncbi:helix-turn-helix domain-containing protein [Acidaminobacter sp. JC074]|uniref:helix-turn-helix domain-containing protein n=1 Tax=Acidaminobacter sp. JC074 TaxID=2530199 RepID=UPI001F0DE936|nr:helix-turn-helix domain-containing protein [Acidaminobacter sp. JC074]MCH4888450.1 helix-turn-helix domain-containing protein [Acidaminobacter sp. JC074]